MPARPLGGPIQVGIPSSSSGRNDKSEADQSKGGSAKKTKTEEPETVSVHPTPSADTSTGNKDERDDKREANRGKTESTKRTKIKVRFDDRSDKRQNQRRNDGPSKKVPRFEVAADGWLELSGEQLALPSSSQSTASSSQTPMPALTNADAPMPELVPTDKRPL